MPLYTYACPKCGEKDTEFNTVQDRHVGPECCGAQMVLEITPTQVANVLGGGSMPGYVCPVSGDYVTSRKQRREIMARHGLIEAGDRSRADENRRGAMLANTNGTGVSD